MGLTLEEALDLAGIRWPRDNKIMCPKGHDRKGASLHLYDDSVYCFGCGYTADSYGLLAALKGVSVGKILATYGDGFRTTDATKELNRHKLRSSVELEITVATTPLFRAIRESKKLRHWQRDLLLLEASEWYEDLRAELLELPPFKIERRLKHMEDEIADWLERWKVK